MTFTALQRSHGVLRATQQDGSYPRPQLVRTAWVDLDREVGFAFDDGDVGLDERWYESAQPFTRRILLPFPPESEASGVADAGFHPRVWYRIELTFEDLAAAGHGDDTRLLLHFGAVDYLATVWLDGTHLGDHEGGQTPFTFDVTAALRGTGPHVLVVRAYEDPADLTQPRGKQDWRERPHDIWYERTTGIWRTVWLEAVPPVHVSRLAWRPDVAGGTVTALLELPTRPELPVDVELTLERDGEHFAAAAARVNEREARITIDLPGDMWSLAHDGYLWSPDRPTLLDAHVVLHGPGGDDVVHSYVGLRDVGITGDRISLSSRPLYLRSVLEQGYWPASHLVPPSPEALRQEVELILALGFNAARVHQKVEDPRFFFWADKLGLTLWGETAAGYVFSSAAVARLTSEWVDIVRTYESHPSIICWVPFNESWGIGAVATDPAQQAYSRGLADLTRALDPTRPVISNDGWEHTDSDLLTIHDYEWSREVLETRYANGVSQLLRNAQAGPRALVVGDRQRSDVPVLLTEIGGIRYAPGDDGSTWGYSTATSDEDYASRIADVLEPIQSARIVAGFCWTQLTDTLQEANGLCTADRRPKLPAEQIRSLVRGSHTRF
jgi:beta-galactosidase/beta-glucuronidase